MSKKNIGFLVFLSFIMVAAFSCATIPELKINYKIPSHIDELKGVNVGLGFQDNRDDKNIFGPGAEERFTGFPGNFSLSVSRGEEDSYKIGLFDLKYLFLEAFKRKLANQGITVTTGKSSDPLIIIILNDFRLDLKERKWTAEMDYEARLMTDGAVRSTQSMNGSAERFRLMGNDQAHALMGELFSDIINKLDVSKLLSQE